MLILVHAFVLLSHSAVVKLKQSLISLHLQGLTWTIPVIAKISDCYIASLCATDQGHSEGDWSVYG